MHKVRTRKARKFPAASSASSAVERLSRAWVSDRKLSFRVAAQRTGRPSSFAACSASTCSGKGLSFMPKPPPTSGEMMRSRLVGTFSPNSAISLRMTCGSCVPVASVYRSSTGS